MTIKFRIVFVKSSCTVVIEKGCPLYKLDSIVTQTQNYTIRAGLQNLQLLKGK